eukprot:2275003-Rhodomonas_salina.1
MQMIHDKWGHPSNTKMERIVRYYKCRGFPPGFLRALHHFNFEVQGLRVLQECACVQAHKAHEGEDGEHQGKQQKEETFS